MLPIWSRDAAVSRRGDAKPTTVAGAVGTLVPFLIGAPAFAQSCDPAVARVISAEGTVEARRAGSRSWVAVVLDDSLCGGDELRTGAYSRAALLLTDQTVMRLDQETVVIFPPPRDEKKTWVDVLKGALHIVTRDRRALRVLTPFANAGIDGTEFLVSVSDSAVTILVFEGQVTMEAAGTAASATSGQQLSVTAGGAPVVTAVVRPRDAVHWTLYYPPIGVPTTGATAGDALAARAAAALAVGRVEEAQRDLDDALARDPDNAAALALRAVMALTQNERERAFDLAERAVQARPASAAALIARSYVQQSYFDLPGALQALQQAAAAEPGNALAQARLAELWLAVGDVERAITAARDAVNAAPGLSLPRTVLGFAYLANVDIARARAEFTEAIRLDSAAPLPRLGLGLAMIRDGELGPGREQIEIAVILDPNNALIRSYMGKAYYEEKRDELAGTQLGIARELDAKDPTAFFYDSIRKQTTNRPVEALQDLRASVALNDNRAVYRSRLLLDQDLAARSAAQGRVYRDLGFGELALRKGWKSVATDPADFSGHRLLADSYSTLPRHEIARVNELLQSQLLQPLNVTPIQPQLGDANLFILDSAGPATIAFNEFNPLFNRNRLAAHSSAVVGGNDTWGVDGVLAGVQDRWSFSLGGYHFETDGFRENNDLDQDSANLFVQYQPVIGTGLTAEARYTDREGGDLVLRFDPEDFFGLRQDEESASLRLGARHEFSTRSAGLALLAYESVSIFNSSLGSTFTDDYDADSYIAELQHLYHTEAWGNTTGARYYGSSVDTQTNFLFPIPDPPFVMEMVVTDSYRPRNISIYSYSDIYLPARITLTVGASADFLDGTTFDRDRVNPKLGLIWEPRDGTTVRLAGFQTLQRPTPSRGNIQPSLEPTPVAGFNQFFFGSEAERARRYGAGVDQRLADRGFVGVEMSRRELNLPFLAQAMEPPFGLVPVSTDVDETSFRAYFYGILTERISVSAEYEYDKFENEEIFTPYRYVTLETHRVPVRLSYFHRAGFGAAVVGTFVDQRGAFQGAPPFFAITRDGDDFWVADAFLQYRLPNRWGIVRLEARNLFDEDFKFQDIDPEATRIPPQRLVLLKFTLAY